MPQETNLNVSPYFDDFDPQKNYYKVLFKPGYPVQARELTGLQSILQNQIEQFGNHIFKEGSVVIPGNINYIDNLYGLVLENTFNGVDVDSYIDNLLGKTIIGQESGVVANVVYVLKKNQENNPNTIIYINYLNSGLDENIIFTRSENVLVQDSVFPGFTETTGILANQAFATVFNSQYSIIGSAVKVSNGVYFLRGSFVNVYDQTLILDYSNFLPSYRVGFEIFEDVVNSDIDESLVDNAKGFLNYAAPGADRFKITATLTKIALDDDTPKNFVELFRIETGIVRKINSNPEYNILSEEFARRTYEESGDYYIKPFKIEVKNSLNDGKGNEGIYLENQVTYQGSVASDDLGVYKVSPGKAYVKGYETEILGSTLVDFEKPRTTKTLKNQGIIYSTGATYSLNRVYGSPSIGFSTSYYVSLRDERVSGDQFTSSGKEIGVARVYDFALESGSYSTLDSNLNEWQISLYDIQTYTEISLNEPITLSTPTFIKGKSTGAVGFLRYDANNSGIITAYNVNGTFAKGEKFIFDGIDNNRVATAITSYGSADVKSLYGLAGTASTFTADTKLYPAINVGSVNITGNSGGISTITSSEYSFDNSTKVGNIVSFSNGGTDPFFAKVTSVSAKTLEIVGITTVSGICDGALPATDISPSDLKVLTSRFLNSTTNTLYTPLSKRNVSSVDLLNSQLNIKKQFDVTITSNSVTISPTDILENEVFLPFDEERYVMIRNDGSIEPLSEDQFVFTSGGRELTINGLQQDGDARLITTLRKVEVKSRVKNKKKVNSILIDRSAYSYSGIGNTTNNDGLVYGNYPYGTRVQDDDISLNVPEVTKIYGIFESSSIADPSTPSIILQNISSTSTTTSEILLGEEIVGEQSGNVAICLERLNSSTIGYVTLNELSFIEGELVTFKESGITAIINTLSSGSNDIKGNFVLNPGQRSTILDYSRITRKSNTFVPKNKIKIYFESAFIPDSDNGDITVVDSYNQFDYCDLQSVDGNKVSDIIDCRPIVKQFDTTNSTYSPFEFFGRSFTEDKNSSLRILASDETIICDYSSYLGRIDRIYLSSETTNFRTSDNFARTPIILVKQGVPSENPQLPDEVANSLEIARVTLPPYLCNLRDAQISLIDHKRYTMSDISRLETRIKNLEYYTSLSILEQNAKNLQIKDFNGIDRFKSGIFVDNFSTTSFQNKSNVIKNSIDIKNSELRPSSFTTEIDLLIGSRTLLGIGTESAQNVDSKYVTDIIGNNIRTSGISANSTGKGVVTLNYTEVSEIVQPFATRIENVTPYLVATYYGTLELNPSSDIWVDQVKLDPLTVEGLETQTVYTDLQLTEGDLDPQGGWNPVIWGAWQDSWTGSTTETSKNGYIETITTTKTGTSTRTGSTSRNLVTYNDVSLGNRVVNIDVLPYMRSRNIEFNAKKLKPFTRLYSFFDGQNVDKFIVPKLIEIEMLEGTFSVGETINGNYSPDTQIRVRCASSNHRYGPFNSPTDIFVKNPYNQTEDIPEVYSANSTILNIDTTSLSDLSNGNYSGNIFVGMILTGNSSKARARVTDIKLVTDRSGVVIGSFFVPNPNILTNPSFTTGTKTLKLTSSQDNSVFPARIGSFAEGNFHSDGLLSKNQETILSLRNTEVQNAVVTGTKSITQTDTQTIDNTPRVTSGGSSGSGSSGSGNAVYVRPPGYNKPGGSKTPQIGVVGSGTAPYKVGNYTRTNSSWKWTRSCSRKDPLAQSFTIGSDDDSIGRFITSIDLYFQSKDEVLPVLIEIRPMSLGTPTTQVYPFSSVVLYPDDINLSDDASVATKVTFPSPVYLEGNKEHAIVLLSDSTNYNVWISRLGEVDITTASGPESAQFLVTEQPLLGSLFKSQNASTWTPSQYEDLKFSLYTARFDTEGSITFFNPDLNENNKQIATLVKDSLQITSRRVRVGLGTTVVDSNLLIGNEITQTGSNASGTYIGSAGSASGTLNIINTGIGYTPSSGSFTFNNVDLTSVTGSGSNAKANISITNGVAVAATISSGGAGYVVGDVLTPTSIGISSLGRNMRLSVVGVGGTNELIIDNVQGDFIVGAGYSLNYSSSLSGVGVTPINGGGVYIDTAPVVISDGLHIKVNHRNHGMHSLTNTVVISNVLSDSESSNIVSEYDSSSTLDLQIKTGTTSIFSTFENIGIGTTNPGYALIDDEIISYTGISGDSLTGITRGIDSTIAVTHSQNSLIYKYELNGVSLRRINKSHQLQDADVSNPIDLDYYTIKVDMSSNGVDRTVGTSIPKLYFNSTKSTGGSQTKATQNISYEIARPVVESLVFPQTRLNAEIRTTSSTSVSGSEISFENQGFEPLSLNENNYFSTPRMIASKVNELNKLTDTLGNKSMEVTFNLVTNDDRLSPSIDLDRVGMILVSNRVNKVIENYIEDPRVSSLKEDPSAFVYATKPIELELPATSIKVVVSAYINPDSDLRAFYAIMKGSTEDPIYYPFPGYLNRLESGQVIDIENSDGTSDNYVTPNDTLGFESNEITFKDYEFSIDNLESFRFFSVKLIGSSINQSYPPRIRDLRVISLA